MRVLAPFVIVVVSSLRRAIAGSSSDRSISTGGL